MRKFFLPLAGMVLVAACAQAADTVNIRGDIFQTCTLSMNSNPLVVDMGKYPITLLSTKNAQSPHKPFEINISGCPGSKIALKLGGNTVNGNADILAVDGAKGVGIVIFDPDINHVYKFNQAPDNNDFRKIPDSGLFVFKFIAYYYSYLDNVTAGQANASVAVEVIYE